MPVMESAPKNARIGQARRSRAHFFSASMLNPPASAMDGWVRPRYKISRQGYAKAPKRKDFMGFASGVILSEAADNYP